LFVRYFAQLTLPVGRLSIRSVLLITPATCLFRTQNNPRHLNCVAMSENTRSSAFRKIDVDQFNENFKDDEQSECPSVATIPDESEITTMINQYPLS
jgi:hypothetical protein